MYPQQGGRGRRAWAGSTRAARLPRDWPAIRARILARDGHRCTRCGAPATDVDHVIPGDDHSENNLVSLCAADHRAKSGREGQAAGVVTRHLAGQHLHRPPEPHPGLTPP